MAKCWCENTVHFFDENGPATGHMYGNETPDTSFRALTLFGEVIMCEECGTAGHMGPLCTCPSWENADDFDGPGDYALAGAGCRVHGSAVAR